MKKIPMAAMLALAAFTLPVSAATYYVNSDTGEDVDPKVNKKAGLSEGAAFKTIQFAIDKAAAGSTILVAPGEYGAIKSNNKKLTIKAMDPSPADSYGSPTLHSWTDEGESAAWAADLGAWGTQSLYGTSVQYNNKKWSSTYGVSFNSGLPGYENEDETLTSIIESYPQSIGWNLPSELEAEAMANGGVPSNAKYKAVAIKGAKAPLWKGGSATKLIGFDIADGENGVAGGSLQYCYIYGCNGMAAWKSSLTDSGILDCVRSGIYGSVGYEAGAGALASGCTMTRCQILYNTFVSGIDNSTLYNCLIGWNMAAEVEEGLNWWDAEDAAADLIWRSTLYNCTVLGNNLASFSIDWGDGEPETRQMIAIGWGCSVFNSIVWNNTGTDGEQHNVIPENFLDIVVTNYNAKGKAVVTIYNPSSQFMNSCTDILIDSSKNKKVKSTGNIAADPCFISPWDYSLAPWSPCVNAGADYQSKTGKTDMFGGPRKVGAKVDMGAVELQAATPVPADYDGDGITDAALCFADTGDWWIWGSQSAIGSGATYVYLPMPKGATPIAADFDGDGYVQPGFFAGAEKEPFFVHLTDGDVVTNSFATYKDAKGKAVSTKGATPVAARLKAGAPATFGIYASAVAAPVYVFENGLTYGGNSKIFAKGSKPVVADFTGDAIDDLGAYTSAAAAPAFTVLRSDEGYSLTAPFTLAANFFYPTARQSIPLGAKGALPCVADYDGDGLADFATYSSTAAAPEFTRLLSSSKYSETRTMPIGSKGDIPVVGNYENAAPAAANMAVFTGSTWRYCDSGYTDVPAVGWPALATE